MVQLYRRRSKIGLVGETIDVETGEWTSRSSHIDGGIDSYYEYLLKAWLLFGDEDCRRMWQEGVEAVNRFVADETPAGLWYGEVDMDTGRKSATYGALQAFFPALLALHGDLDRARRLQESSFRMWTQFGAEPDEFDYQTLEPGKFAGYQLRPEIIESAYYLHTFTQDPRYLTMGRTFLDDLVARCRTGAGYTVLQTVVSGKQGDKMPSYFLAETLKYLYLLFAPPEVLDLRAVVFNTEAHPLRRTW